MQAETVYNVYQALPEEEKARLYIMLDAERKAVATPLKADDRHYTIEEAMDVILKQLDQQKANRFNNKDMKVV